MAPDRGTARLRNGSEKTPEKSEPLLIPAEREKPARVSLKRVIALLAIAVYLLRFYKSSVLRLTADETGKEQKRGAFGLPASTIQSLGPYSPWYPAAEYQPWPTECTVKQVHIRHGARYPTSDASVKLKAAVDKLKRASSYKDEQFEFLRDFAYELGENDLVEYGREEVRASARSDYQRYRHLFETDEAAWVRASISKRVVESSRIWMDEIASLSDARARIEGPLICDDKPWMNNTLSAHMCQNLDTKPANEAARRWTNTTGAAIAARLNKRAPGADLDGGNVPALIFHSVVTGKASPFCSLFTKQELAAFERFTSEIKFYSNGPGNELGPVQGVGYVNELLTRLFELGPLVDETQSNHSMPFPLGRKIYADFTHDTLLVSVLSALGLASLDVESFHAGDICPFSGRLVFERADCTSKQQALPHQQSLRVLLNDKELKRWSAIGRFHKEQSYAREMGKGDWQKCGAVSRPEDVRNDDKQYETI